MWMRNFTVKRVSDRDIKSQQDHLVIEKTISLQLADTPYQIACTQGLEKELVLGAALAKTGISDWEIQTSDPWHLTPATTQPTAGTVHHEASLTKHEIFLLTAYFQEKAFLYKHTGITQSAAFASSKTLLCFAEDLYTLSAVYKAMGQSLQGKISREILIVSGRIDEQLINIAIQAGTQIVISRTGVTDKAFDLANTHNMTIVGFARGMRFNLYTHTGRIKV